MDKSLKYRAVCPECGKAFDTRKEGFNFGGYIICAKCYHKKPYETYIH